MTETRIKIEPANESDLDELVRLHAGAFAESIEMYGVGPPGYNDRALHQTRLDEHFYFKIFSGVTLIGGIIVQDYGEGDYFLDTIFVGPDFQNLGVGHRAMSLLEAEFPNATRWILVTPYRDVRNHHFYETQGYEKTDELPFPDAGSDPDFALFKYEKRID